MNENNLSEKLSLVICGILVSPSIIILQVNLLTEKAHQKNFTLFKKISVGIFFGEANK
jgi:hypothetical protein